MKKVGRVAGWVDDRTGAAKGVGYLMKKVFPDHWSFMLGEVAMYSMIITLPADRCVPDLLVRAQRGPGGVRRLPSPSGAS